MHHERHSKFGRVIANILWFIILPIHIIRWLFPSKVCTEKYTVEAPGLSDSKVWRIVQLSDFHWDFVSLRICDSLMNEVVQKVTELKPDLIVLTGDFVQKQPEPIHEFAERYVKRLKSSSRFGVFAVLGN